MPGKRLERRHVRDPRLHEAAPNRSPRSQFIKRSFERLSRKNYFAEIDWFKLSNENL